MGPLPYVVLFVIISCLVNVNVTLSSNRQSSKRGRIDLFYGDNAIRFVNHKLYSVNLNNDLPAIEGLVKLRDTMEIDFWNEPEPNQKLNFRVPPKYQGEIEQFMNKSRLGYSVLTSDLQKWIDQERTELQDPSDLFSSRQEMNDFALDHYHTYEEINQFMDHLEKKFPDVVKVSNIGKTFENHDIRGITIGLPRADNETELGPKPVYWLDAGIHAREWIAPATAVFVMNELVTKHETDSEIRYLLQKFDFFILPIANPDGYMFTWWTNRLWRKNRAVPKTIPFRYPWALFDECVGTDPNRNFDVDFGGASTSSNPCSDIFRGDGPFSEMETRAIRDQVQYFGKRIKVYVSLHSYSQMWMFPYGYTSAKKSHHHNELSDMILRVVLNVQKKHGVWYRHGPVATTIYPASGSSPDWAHEKADVKYSFIAELRDRGDHGFILPRQEIVPCAEETWEGIKTIANERTQQ